METRHPYGLCLRRLGSRLGFDTCFGFRRAVSSLSGPRLIAPSLGDVGCLHCSGCWFAPAMRSESIHELFYDGIRRSPCRFQLANEGLEQIARTRWFGLWRPARFTVFLKLNARFSLPMSSIALNLRDGKDHRLSLHRHHCRVRIRLLAIVTDEAQMTHFAARR